MKVTGRQGAEGEKPRSDRAGRNCWLGNKLGAPFYVFSRREPNLAETNMPWQVWPASPWKYLGAKPDLNKHYPLAAVPVTASGPQSFSCCPLSTLPWSVPSCTLAAFTRLLNRVALILQGTAPSLPSPRPFLFDLQLSRRACRPPSGCMRPGHTNARRRRLLQSLHQGSVQLPLENLQQQPGTSECFHPPWP